MIVEAKAVMSPFYGKPMVSLYTETMEEAIKLAEILNAMKDFVSVSCPAGVAKFFDDGRKA